MLHAVGACACLDACVHLLCCLCVCVCTLNACYSLSSAVYREPNEIFKFKNHGVKTRERESN